MRARITITIAIAALLGFGMAPEAVAQQSPPSPAAAGQAQRAPASPAEQEYNPDQLGKQHETHRGQRVQPTPGHVAARQQHLKQEPGGAAGADAAGEYTEKLYGPLISHSKHLLKGHYQHPLRRAPGNFPANAAAPSAVP
jgi:hypothetical protein